MSNVHPNIDDALLDRLVDDELSTDDKGRLLASLDDEPGGWRRCALAFVEAQAWRGTLGQVMHESATDSLTRNCRSDLNRSAATARPQRILSNAQRHPPGLAAWKPLGIAAGIMLAFTFGMVWRGGMRTTVPPAGQIKSAQSVDHGASMVTLPRRGDDLQSRRIQPSLVGTVPGGSITVPSDDAVVLLIGGNGTPERQIQVPLIESSVINEQFGHHLQPAVPETVRRRLERAGYRVESQRRYAPVWANGGQQMLVPVDDTKIVPVKRDVY